MTRVNIDFRNFKEIIANLKS